MFKTTHHGNVTFIRSLYLSHTCTLYGLSLSLFVETLSGYWRSKIETGTESLRNLHKG